MWFLVNPRSQKTLGNARNFIFFRATKQIHYLLSCYVFYLQFLAV